MPKGIVTNVFISRIIGFDDWCFSALLIFILLVWLCLRGVESIYFLSFIHLYFGSYAQSAMSSLLCLIITSWTWSLSFLKKKNVFVLHQMTDHPDSYNRIIPRNQCAVFWAWESLKLKISKQRTKNIRWIKNVKNIHISVLYKKKKNV